MQRKLRLWQGGGIALAFSLLLAAVVFSANVMATPVQAQGRGGNATPTPTDPLWLGFSAARDAIEEQEGTDLTYVARWEWWQDDFQFGIDDCVAAVMVDNPAAARPIYIGWTFQITSLNNVTYEARVSYNLQIVVVCDEPSQVAAAPTPGAGTPNPNLPPPVAGGAVSGSFELGGHVLELNTNTISLLQRSGMTWVKKQVRYTLGADPSSVAGIVQQVQGAGFRVLLGIVGNPSEMTDYDSYIQSYSAFVAGVARLGVNGIEVWNEPNIVREWPANSINGGTYTRLLASAYNAIKTANPNVLVISGAPSPTGYFGAAGCAVNSPTDAGCNDDVFMQQMAAAGQRSISTALGCTTTKALSRHRQPAVTRVATTRPTTSSPCWHAVTTPSVASRSVSPNWAICPVRASARPSRQTLRGRTAPVLLSTPRGWQKPLRLARRAGACGC